MVEQENAPPEEEAPSTKEMLVDEGKITVKDAGLGIIEALQRGGHRIVSVLGRHKKIQEIEAEVDADTARVKESIADLEE